MVANNIPESDVVLAKHVGARGGDLRILLEDKTGWMCRKGEMT